MISFVPVVTERRNSSFPLVDLVDEAVGGRLVDGDVLVISSKFMSISEGRTVSLSSVKAGERAKKMARLYNQAPELCELVIRESDEIVGGVVGFILASRDGLLTPNAGIDKSNIDHGMVVLYPRKAAESASSLVEAMKYRRGVEVGVVVSDSRLMPTRRGTTGVALAAAGIDAIVDLRGKVDLFGNVLKVTSQAIADDICSGAQLAMGESNESTPIVLVKGIRQLISEERYDSTRLSIPTEQCVYMRSLGYAQKRSRAS